MALNVKGEQLFKVNAAKRYRFKQAVIPFFVKR
jgi:hypothetical protein